MQKGFLLGSCSNREQVECERPKQNDENRICARCPVKLRKLRQLETKRSEDQQNRMERAEAKPWSHGGSHRIAVACTKKAKK